MKVTSSSMQYVQRRLQRSVTLIRRLLWTRPKVSINRSIITRQRKDSGQQVSNFHRALGNGQGLNLIPDSKNQLLSIAGQSRLRWVRLWVAVNLQLAVHQVNNPVFLNLGRSIQ